MQAPNKPQPDKLNPLNPKPKLNLVVCSAASEASLLKVWPSVLVVKLLTKLLEALWEEVLIAKNLWININKGGHSQQQVVTQEPQQYQAQPQQTQQQNMCNFENTQFISVRNFLLHEEITSF